MTKEARSLTIFCCISSVFLLGIIIWGIGSIKDGRKKLSRIDLEQRQSEYGQKKTDEIPKKIVEKVNVPVYLAGGINSANVLEAIRMVKPYGIDLCSSARTNGKLDVNKLSELFSKLNAIY